jgi:hypothetical protein
MALLKTLTGEGGLFDEDGDMIGPVKYHIEVWQRGIWIDTNGFIVGDEDVLSRGLDAHRTILALSNGIKVVALMMGPIRNNSVPIEISRPIAGIN